MNHKISVVIPTYNEEKSIAKCLNSLTNQTYKNHEILVIDNNSTDETYNIIKKFQKINKKIKYIFEPKQGRSYARNSGIKNSRSKIIAMIDADCIAPKNWLDILTKPIRTNKEKITMGGESVEIKNFWTLSVQKKREECLKNYLKNEHISILDTKNFAIKSNLAKNILFDNKLKRCEDTDFYLRIKNKAKIKYIKNINVKHYHEASFFELIKINFISGFWIGIIYKKHKKNPQIINDGLFNFLKYSNIISYPFWFVKQIYNKPINELYFEFLYEISFKAGGIIGQIHKKSVGVTKK